MISGVRVLIICCQKLFNFLSHPLFEQFRPQLQWQILGLVARRSAHIWLEEKLMYFLQKMDSAVSVKYLWYHFLNAYARPYRLAYLKMMTNSIINISI